MEITWESPKEVTFNVTLTREELEVITALIGGCDAHRLKIDGGPDLYKVYNGLYHALESTGFIDHRHLTEIFRKLMRDV